MRFEKANAWRNHPHLQNLLKDPLPGFRLAVVIYGSYLVGEFAYNTIVGKKDHHH